MALENKQLLTSVVIDETYAIYGPEGTGKTVIASSFPKSETAKLYYLEIKEGGTGSIPRKYANTIEVIPIQDYDDYLYTLDQIQMLGRGHVGTVVTDSATNLMEMMKDWLKRNAGKTAMNQDLWGKVNEELNKLAIRMRDMHQSLGCRTVLIFHDRALDDENNPELGRVIPSATPKGAKGICAKTSYVWYTNTEFVDVVQPDSTYQREHRFYAIIDTYPNLSTKCRKPPKFSATIEKKMYNISYNKFYKEVISKMSEA